MSERGVRTLRSQDTGRDRNFYENKGAALEWQIHNHELYGLTGG